MCTGDPLLLLLLLQSEAVSADINPLFVHAGPAFIKNVRARVWKCIVECARVVIVFFFFFFVVLVLAVTDCLPSPTSGVCRHPRHILPQMQSHFRNVILFFFLRSVCPKCHVPSMYNSFLNQVYVLLLPYLHRFLCVTQITCLLSGRLSADSSS